MGAAAVYILAAVTSGICSGFLLRGYSSGRRKLLLWSGLCFLMLAVSNLLLFLDLVILPVQVSLYRWRLATAIVAMALLLYGLIWEGK